MEYHVHLVAEDTLTTDTHRRISALLVAAFPQYADLFSKASYYYARPEFRLWLEDEHGLMVAHLDFERRTIGVGEREVLIAGVGEVATHPDVQGKGVGRQLMDALRRVLREQYPVDFGLLECREAVVGYYERVGWRRVYQPVIELDVDSGEEVNYTGPVMVMPAARDDWPEAGTIHLRGLPW